VQYLLLNKPYGVVCQFTQGPEAEAKLADYITVPGV
jgi:hypothetical protein